jgi:hypothetical protein
MKASDEARNMGLDRRPEHRVESAIWPRAPARPYSALTVTRPQAPILAGPRSEAPKGRAARDSVSPRKVACRPAGGGGNLDGPRPPTRALEG